MGISHQKPRENWEFGLGEKVRTLCEYIFISINGTCFCVYVSLSDMIMLFQILSNTLFESNLVWNK